MTDSSEISPKQTLRYGDDPGMDPDPFGSLSSTLTGIAPEPVQPVDLMETQGSDPAIQPRDGDGLSPSLTLPGRTTVLPRRKPGDDSSELEQRARFDRVRTLGAGGMGEVELAKDNDIRRTVAVKKLRADLNSKEAVLRFADEVRIIGQLEHPAIVPVYDVGRDEAGQVYLVMKHLTGETMESVIERLRAREPSYLERFTIPQRVQVFLGVLDAIRYAHARRVIHRDLKPANIMIGPYGEVTVLDWGVAKVLGHDPSSNDVQPLDRTVLDTQDKARSETGFGSLVGTPLYMSPEQAAGRNGELDERSDVYSLSVVLYEWLTLEHPLKDKQTVTEVLAAVISEDYGNAAADRALQMGVPVEYVRLLALGLARDRDRRIQSVALLESQLQSALAGCIPVECPITLAKRTAHEVVTWIDRHPTLYLVLFSAVSLTLLLTLGLGIWQLVRIVSE